jgi:hypothetical protein
MLRDSCTLNQKILQCADKQSIPVKLSCRKPSLRSFKMTSPCRKVIFLHGEVILKDRKTILKECKIISLLKKSFYDVVKSFCDIV